MTLETLAKDELQISEAVAPAMVKAKLMRKRRQFLPKQIQKSDAIRRSITRNLNVKQVKLLVRLSPVPVKKPKEIIAR